MLLDKTYPDYLQKLHKDLHVGIGYNNVGEINKLVSLQTISLLFDGFKSHHPYSLSELTDMYLPNDHGFVDLPSEFVKNAHIGIMYHINSLGHLTINAVDVTEAIINPEKEHHYYPQSMLLYIKNFNKMVLSSSHECHSSGGFNGGDLVEYLINKIVPRLIETKMTMMTNRFEAEGNTVWRLNHFKIENYDDDVHYSKIDKNNELVIKKNIKNSFERGVLNKVVNELRISFAPQNTEQQRMFRDEPFSGLREVVKAAKKNEERINKLKEELKKYAITDVNGDGNINILCQLIRNYRKDDIRVTQIINKNSPNKMEMAQLYKWVGTLYEIEPEFMNEFFKNKPALQDQDISPKPKRQYNSSAPV